MAGRKPKLTEELRDDLCRHIEAGQFQGVAAELVGVHEGTFWRWMALGADDLAPDGTVVRKARSPFREFREAVTRARTRAEAACQLTIRLSAQNGDWKAAAFWLERVLPERWARKQAIEHTGKDGGPVQVRTQPSLDLSKLSTDELRDLEQLLALAAVSPAAPAG
ncbi:MAG TPA: hypothetical protein VFP27_06190 [Mycobacterium sp.]|nr:hypothetical protein [Mycobacterium sp.]